MAKDINTLKNSKEITENKLEITPKTDFIPEIELTPAQIEAENQSILRAYRKFRKLAQPFITEKEEAKLVRSAFKFAVEAHKGVRRKSGEPYIFHPIAVAQIVVEEIGLGATAIAAAFLHDVVEDTDITNAEIERKFGKTVALLVEGLTKIQLSKDQALEKVNWGISQQVENFRKMILTLSDDVRVILVKLADRLHNMRTLEGMQPHKQLKIASETIFIYAPLAHRLGLYSIKTELEDLHLKFSQPKVYREIAHKLEDNKAQRNKYIKEFITPIEEKLKEQGFKAKVFGRSKSIYSIWNKIQSQGIPFEEIYDLFAIRIVLDCAFEKEKAECWHVFSIVTDFYRPNTKRMRDWITNPRSNGYESLHITVMGPEGKWVEVQIRTERMDEIAEKGYAAHWKYKTHGKHAGRTEESHIDSWLRTIRELREQSDSLTAMEFVSAFRANFLQEEIYVYTPKGEIIKLPHGATALDFAFHVHSQVGLSCLGAKIHKGEKEKKVLVPINYELKSGDQVEIITSKTAKPNADWLKFVTTTKAKGRIKDYIRDEKKEFVTKGKEIVQKKFEQFGFEYSDTNQNQLREFLNYKFLGDVYFDIGKNIISTKQLNKFEKYKKQHETQLAQSNQLRTQNPSENYKKDKNALELVKDTIIIGQDFHGIDYSLAKCCTPIPGGDVFGYVTINEGVKIHRTNCPNAVEMLSNHGYRVIKAIWQSQKNTMFAVTLKLEGTDRMGIIRDVTMALTTDMGVNITAFNIGLRESGIFEGEIGLYVRDQEHFDNLLEKMLQIDGIVTAKRLDGEE